MFIALQTLNKNKYQKEVDIEQKYGHFVYTRVDIKMTSVKTRPGSPIDRRRLPIQLHQ